MIKAWFYSSINEFLKQKLRLTQEFNTKCSFSVVVVLLWLYAPAICRVWYCQIKLKPITKWIILTVLCKGCPDLWLGSQVYWQTEQSQHFSTFNLPREWNHAIYHWSKCTMCWNNFWRSNFFSCTSEIFTKLQCCNCKKIEEKLQGIIKIMTEVS